MCMTKGAIAMDFIVLPKASKNVTKDKHKAKNPDNGRLIVWKYVPVLHQNTLTLGDIARDFEKYCNEKVLKAQAAGQLKDFKMEFRNFQIDGKIYDKSSLDSTPIKDIVQDGKQMTCNIYQEFKTVCGCCLRVFLILQSEQGIKKAILRSLDCLIFLSSKQSTLLVSLTNNSKEGKTSLNQTNETLVETQDFEEDSFRAKKHKVVKVKIPKRSRLFVQINQTNKFPTTDFRALKKGLKHSIVIYLTEGKKIMGTDILEDYKKELENFNYGMSLFSKIRSKDEKLISEIYHILGELFRRVLYSRKVSTLKLIQDPQILTVNTEVRLQDYNDS
ncbi:UNKNOWN [Stylonychia lemnae]|uniref:Uncharacterized protein n=1 Tax=Stylonychia lemnae TaxID=5949 RepID=A0A078APA5_STYLE|nr:UNKNOWN [Stylonychia lemnae]|eukprot:CDW83959.1 UNKNOWN [Stylonychia lemnae]